VLTFAAATSVASAPIMILRPDAAGHQRLGFYFPLFRSQSSISILPCLSWFQFTKDTVNPSSAFQSRVNRVYMEVLPPTDNPTFNPTWNPTFKPTPFPTDNPTFIDSSYTVWSTSYNGDNLADTPCQWTVDGSGGAKSCNTARLSESWVEIQVEVAAGAPNFAGSFERRV
jgi:hypothetical protein